MVPLFGLKLDSKTVLAQNNRSIRTERTSKSLQTDKCPKPSLVATQDFAKKLTLGAFLSESSFLYRWQAT